MISNPMAFSLIVEIFDLHPRIMKCSLCNRTTRYCFFAKSRKKGSTVKIAIGIECSSKVHNENAEKLGISNKEWLKLNKVQLMNNAAMNLRVLIISAIAEKEGDFSSKSIIDNLHASGLTARQAKLIAGLSIKNNISIPSGLFKIEMSNSKNKQQVLDMKFWEIKLLDKILSPRQVSMINNIRKTNHSD